MYEQFGIEGLKAYDKTVKYCQQRRALLSLAMLSAEISAPLPLLMQPAISARCRWEVMLLQSFDTEYITVNPYLGTDGVKPFVDVCNEYDRGIFVLVKTSNPSSGEFQDRLIDGKPLYYELVAGKGGGMGEAHGWSLQ